MIILWGAIEQFGFVGSLWFIPLGAIGGAVLLGFGGGWLYEFLIMLEDRRTGLPESGSFGGLGRAIVELIIILLGGMDWFHLRCLASRKFLVSFVGGQCPPYFFYT